MYNFVYECITKLALYTLVVIFAICSVSAQEASTKYSPEPAPVVLEKPTDNAYLIQPYDVLNIQVWPYEDLNLTATVRPDGTISYPFLGEVVVKGISAGQLGDVISRSLEPYMKGPKVAINITNIRHERAYVLGDVNKPGQYEIRAGDTVMDLVSKAGGFTERAKKSDVGLIRAPKSITDRSSLGMNESIPSNVQGELFHLNLATLLGEGDFPAEYFVRDGDVLFIPSGKKVDWRKVALTVSSLYQVFRLDDALFNDNN